MNKIDSNKKYANIFPLLLSVLMVLFIFFNLQDPKKIKNVETSFTNVIAHSYKTKNPTSILKHPTPIKKHLIKTTTNLTQEVVLKTPTYNALVNETAQWIKEHENPIQFASYEVGTDSLEFDIAERLIVQSILKNYALKKEILQAKLEKVADEKEAYDYLMNSKEWEQIIQYDKWAKAFLKKHPGTFTPIDSLRSF